MKILVCAVPAWPAIGQKDDREPKVLSAAGQTVNLGLAAQIVNVLAEISTAAFDINLSVILRFVFISGI